MFSRVISAMHRKVLSWRISWAEEHAKLLEREIATAPRQLKALEADIQCMRVEQALLLPPIITKDKPE